MVCIFCAQLSYGRDIVQMKSDQHEGRGQVDREARRIRRRGSMVSLTFYFTETETDESFIHNTVFPSYLYYIKEVLFVSQSKYNEDMKTIRYTKMETL